MKKAKIDSIKVKIVNDTDPDLSWLDQYEDSTDREEKKYYIRDQKRKAEYGQSWWMVGIFAEATIHIPSGQGSCKIETIGSGGLWGIESDIGEAYFREVASGQVSELLGYLKTLNVECKNFDALANEAVEDLDY